MHPPCPPRPPAGEKARRRDPRCYRYQGVPCPDFRKVSRWGGMIWGGIESGKWAAAMLARRHPAWAPADVGRRLRCRGAALVDAAGGGLARGACFLPLFKRPRPVRLPAYPQGTCKRGDACTYAHGVFECWLHPSRYRTQVGRLGRGAGAEGSTVKLSGTGRLNRGCASTTTAALSPACVCPPSAAPASCQDRPTLDCGATTAPSWAGTACRRRMASHPPLAHPTLAGPSAAVQGGRGLPPQRLLLCPCSEPAAGADHDGCASLLLPLPPLLLGL